jgi:hypothetical protein
MVPDGGWLPLYVCVGKHGAWNGSTTSDRVRVCIIMALEGEIALIGGMGSDLGVRVRSFYSVALQSIFIPIHRPIVRSTDSKTLCAVLLCFVSSEQMSASDRRA